MRLVLALCCLLLVSACAGSSKEYVERMNRWIGASEKELVSTWGVPDKSYQVDSKTLMLAYVDRKNVSYPGTFSTCVGGWGGRFGYNNCIGGVPPTNETYVCETTFMLVSGRVTKWGTKGGGCRSY